MISYFFRSLEEKDGDDIDCPQGDYGLVVKEKKIQNSIIEKEYYMATWWHKEEVDLF